jgi:uncharacterized membrane protein YqiK
MAEFLAKYGLGLGVGVFIVFIILLIILAKWYRRTAANEALVRTGRGGRKVVIDGGIFQIPILHRIQPISLETMKLRVSRVGAEAFITSDSLRADIEAEFYIRVEAKEDDILGASRTLGDKSLNPETLRELEEGKLIGALRSVAATQTLQDLHEKRQEFADGVQEACMDDLMSNGLTLESVSITNLDQIDVQHLDPESNTFDAVGLMRISEVTEEQRKQRNEVERNAEVAIKEKDVEAQKQQLKLEQDQSFAESEQKRQVATYAAEQEAETARFKAEQDRLVQEAEIERDRSVEQAKIQSELAVEKANIERQMEIERQEKERERVETDRLQATRELEMAQAQKEMDVAIVKANAELEANKILAEAARVRAQGEQAGIEAKNVTEQKVLSQEVAMALVQSAPSIVEQLMKPAEKIDSIRVLDFGGDSNSSNLGRVTSSIIGAGSALPLLKEFLSMPGASTDQIIEKAAEYVKNVASGTGESESQ